MAEREDPKDFGLANAAARAGTLVRKLPTARRLLVATIGAATVQFLAGCGNSSVANLMAAPDVPQSGQGGRGGPGGQGGRAGQGGQGGRGGNAGFYVSNLMAPPFVPDSGTGGSGGSGGAAPDMDAGTDDDAGQA